MYSNAATPFEVTEHLPIPPGFSPMPSYRDASSALTPTPRQLTMVELCSLTRFPLRRSELKKTPSCRDSNSQNPYECNHVVINDIPPGRRGKAGAEDCSMCSLPWRRLRVSPRTAEAVSPHPERDQNVQPVEDHCTRTRSPRRGDLLPSSFPYLHPHFPLPDRRQHFLACPLDPVLRRRRNLRRSGWAENAGAATRAGEVHTPRRSGGC